jgi:hypothetical protein
MFCLARHRHEALPLCWNSSGIEYTTDVKVTLEVLL